MPAKNLFCIFLLLLSQQYAHAQASEPIEADRPDQSESPTTTPKGYFQAEFGFSAEKAGKDNQTFSYPSALFKYGICSRVDLRLIAQLVSGKEDGEKFHGVQPVALGLRVNLIEEKGIVPKTSLLADVGIPFLASKDFRSSYYAPALKLAMENDLSKKVSLSYNIGADWEDKITEPVYIYTLSTGVSITDKTGTYLELYGFLPKDERPDHRIDGGFSFLVNNDMVLDISGGKSISNSYYFFATGFSFRFNTKRHAGAKQKSESNK